MMDLYLQQVSFVPGTPDSRSYIEPMRGGHSLLIAGKGSSAASVRAGRVNAKHMLHIYGPGEEGINFVEDLRNALSQEMGSEKPLRVFDYNTLEQALREAMRINSNEQNYFCQIEVLSKTEALPTKLIMAILRNATEPAMRFCAAEILAEPLGILIIAPSADVAEWFELMMPYLLENGVWSTYGCDGSFFKTVAEAMTVLFDIR
jgi:hypothetical protein